MLEPLGRAKVLPGIAISDAVSAFPALVTVAGITFLVAPLWRWSYVMSDYMNMTPLATYIGTPTCLDSLGMGALFAILARRHANNHDFPRLVWLVMLPISLVVTLELMLRPGDISIVLHDASQSCLFGCIVFLASCRLLPRGPFETVPLLQIGKISYGIYVLHPLMPALASYLSLRTTGIALREYSWQWTCSVIALTSYRIIVLGVFRAADQQPEAPLLNR